MSINGGPKKVHARNEQGKPICGAKLDGGKRLCQSPFTMLNGRCKSHGGMALKGTEAPNYQGKGYSQYIPRSLGPAYDAVANDQDLLNLTENLRLVEARIIQVIGRLDSGEAGHLWKQLYTAWQEFKHARSDEDTDREQGAIRQLESILARGKKDSDAWDELIRLTDHKKRLKESEEQHRVRMASMVTTERLDLLAGKLIQIINENVDDPAKRRRISEQMAVIIAGGNLHALASG